MKARIRTWWPEIAPLIHSLPWTLGLLWRSHPGATVAVAVLALVQSTLPALQLWVTKLLIDQIVLVITLAPTQRTQATLTAVFFYLLLEAGMLLGSVLVGTLSSYLYHLLGERLTYHIQQRILQQCTRLDLAAYESTTYYDELKRAQAQAQQGPTILLRRLLELAQAALTLLSMTTLIVLYKPWLVFILIGATVPGFWVALHYGQQRFFLFNNRTPDSRRADYLSDVLSSEAYAKEVRIWDLSHYFLGLIQQLRTRFIQENIALARKQALAGFGGETLSTLGYYTAYLMVIVGVLGGALTIGDLTLYAGVFSRSQSLFERLLQSLAQVYETQLFVQNLMRFLRLEPQVVAPAQPRPLPAPPGELRIENLSFTYPGTAKQVLTKLNFTVRPGECVAIVGANGSGKTTLIKLLLRLYDPDQGHIRLDGVDTRTVDPVQLRQQMAVVFQDYARYQLSARENIGVGRLDQLENLLQIRRAANQAGIDGALSHLPAGYATLLGRQFEGGCELSLGQWQRVAIARALLRDAPILILDEPTAAMDAQAEYELYQQLKELARDRMTILISHRFSTVRMADRILVLEDGKIVEEGTHATLLEQNTRYAYLFKLQAASYQMA